MDIYLPIAGLSVNALLIVALGGLVGILSGMFGVGGGFLTTPLLIFYGIPPTVAVASATTQITGVQRVRRVRPLAPRRGRLQDGRGDDRRRRGRQPGRRLPVPLAPGERPDRPRHRLPLRPAARVDRGADAQGCAGRLGWVAAPAAPADKPRHNRWVAALPMRWRFYASGLYLSPLAPLALGFLAGIMTVLLGSAAASSWCRR
jgi:hypothetical protein